MHPGASRLGKETKARAAGRVGFVLICWLEVLPLLLTRSVTHAGKDARKKNSELKASFAVNAQGEGKMM